MLLKRNNANKIDLAPFITFILFLVKRGGGIRLRLNNLLLPFFKILCRIAGVDG